MSLWVITRKSRQELEEILVQSYDRERDEYNAYYQEMALHRRISLAKENFLFSNRKDIMKVKMLYYTEYLGYIPHFEKNEPFFPILVDSKLGEKDYLKAFKKEETRTFTRSERALATLHGLQNYTPSTTIKYSKNNTKDRHIQTLSHNGLHDLSLSQNSPLFDDKLKIISESDLFQHKESPIYRNIYIYIYRGKWVS